MSSTADITPPLLRAPLELRREIYTFALYTSYTLDRSGQPHYRRPRKITYLLSVNLKIRKDSLKIFYSINRFRICQFLRRDRRIWEEMFQSRSVEYRDISYSAQLFHVRRLMLHIVEPAMKRNCPDGPIVGEFLHKFLHKYDLSTSSLRHLRLQFDYNEDMQSELFAYLLKNLLAENNKVEVELIMTKASPGKDDNAAKFLHDLAQRTNSPARKVHFWNSWTIIRLLFEPVEYEYVRDP